ncbi:hypothetical protein KOM00_08150 [Geomonas sp. Red69]|uniref:Carboxypeptidase regulatory-like domain-containing protein n=1 Tax=Geomonas diazotrophica TaxID=2843197 RepID=A0ABX8JJC2_9BACT|nr:MULTISPECIES: hypothetical protein [Geomonas]MBU5636704.1 hypothetical protein [Geomonas diazotrophica]QWV98480.1 hypothetical protein KP005_04115 [Geomonas nitrogeniifigens]QXE87663.1 hypothetical protein KP003_04475 [Geomonas nitrogeniifigens]
MVRILFAAFSLMLVTATASQAVWPVYHEPAFDGKVLDIDTKQPVEGAVVVAIYNKRSIGAGAGQSAAVINIKEALTDKEGKFHIPSYTTILAQPFTRQDRTGFLIYKPGYASVLLPLKNHFTGKTTAERELSPWYDPVLSGKYKIRLRGAGIVELPRLATKDEKLRNLPALPDQLENLGKQKNLTRLINEEKKELGEPALDPYKVRQYLMNPAKGQK